MGCFEVLFGRGFFGGLGCDVEFGWEGIVVVDDGGFVGLILVQMGAQGACAEVVVR